MNDIFPPQFYTYGSEVVAGMNTKEMNQEVDSLVKKYTQGSKYAQKSVSNKRLASKKHAFQGAVVDTHAESGF